MNAIVAPPRAIGIDGQELVVYSQPGPHKEGGNQDAAGWMSCDGQLVLAVADGLGGMPGGARASGLAIEAMRAAVLEPEQPGSLRARILDGFERANREVLDLRLGAGTTLVVAEIGGGSLRIYHAGDSAALLVGQRGRVKLETMAHSPVGYRVAAGAVDPDEAHLEEDRNLLSNHVGSSEMHVEIGPPVPLARRDTLLLASDGVLDNIRREALVEIIRVGALERAATALVEHIGLTMEGGRADFEGNPDDATFFLFRPGPASFEVSS